MSDLLAHVDGWWWPAIDRDARPVITYDCLPSIQRLLEHTAGRDCIVQAGANVGTYALALADRFQRVLTFEPDPLNYECLAKNLAARDSLRRVEAFRGALGEGFGLCERVVVSPHNVGAHRVRFDAGDIPAFSLDSIIWTMVEPPKVDCIWLDVEGSELHALKGAKATIEAFSPIIAVEEKGLGEAFGIGREDMHLWLSNLDYERIDRIGNDNVYRRRT